MLVTQQQIDAPISVLIEFGLTQRIVNKLELYGWRKIGDLETLRTTDVLAIHGLGPTSLQNIANSLFLYFKETFDE